MIKRYVLIFVILYLLLILVGAILIFLTLNRISDSEQLGNNAPLWFINSFQDVYVYWNYLVYFFAVVYCLGVFREFRRVNIFLGIFISLICLIALVLLSLFTMKILVHIIV